jgi:hypothetical protein
MSTQEADTFATGGRGAANGAGTLSAGATITAFSPASNGDNWIAQSAPSAFSYNSGTKQGQTTGANSANIITLNGFSSATINGVPTNYSKKWQDTTVVANFQRTNTGDDCSIIVRFQDVNNYYRAGLNSSGQLYITKLVGGVSTVLGTPFSFADGGAKFTVKFTIQGFGANGAYNNLQAKIWLATGSEPSNYQVVASDASLLAPGLVGVRMKGATNGSIQSVDSFLATDLSAPLQPAPAYAPYQDARVGATIYFSQNAPNPINAQTPVDLSNLANGAWIREQYQVQGVLETAPGIRNWAYLDHLVWLCNRAGVRVCACLEGFPVWYLDINGAGQFVSMGTGDFADPTMAANFATAAATRYNGQNGYGFIDMWQIGNEEYDATYSDVTTAQRDGLGKVLAMEVNAVYPAIRAASPSALIALGAVRKTPTNALAHIINWMNNLLSNLNKSVVGDFIQDTHSYRDGASAGPDPYSSDSNTPNIQTTLNTIYSMLQQYGFYESTVMVGEFGWNMYDDGSGVSFSLNASTGAITAGVPITSINVTTPLASNIPNATPITLDYGSSSVQETGLYTYGQATTSPVQVTSNPLGNGAAQAAFTPRYNHANSAACYGATLPLDTWQAATTYYQELLDAVRQIPYGRAFCFTINANTTIDFTKLPPKCNTSGDPKSLAATYLPQGGYQYLPPYYIMQYYARNPLTVPWTPAPAYRSATLTRDANSATLTGDALAATVTAPAP